MAKWLYNASEETIYVMGVPIASEAYHLIPVDKELGYAANSNILSKIASGNLKSSLNGTSIFNPDDPGTHINVIKGGLPTEVQTRAERSDVSMKLCRNSGTTSSGSLTLEFKVPGTFGSDSGRLIAGGFAFFSNGVGGDYVEEINVVDKDNNYGAGAGYVVKTWHDEAEASYQDTGLWLLPGSNLIQSMGDWGEIPAGLYLQLKVKKKSGESDDEFYVTLIWGEVT